MDLHHEVTELVRDARRIYRLWRTHPGRVIAATVTALTRSFLPTQRNSHVLWASFITLTAFLGAFAIGRAVFDWGAVDTIIVPFAAAWLFLFGRVFEIEFEVVLPSGITVDTGDDTAPDDPDTDASDADT